MLDFLFVPTILFIVIVMPIWITLHYRSAGKAQSGLDQGDREQLDDLLSNIDKLTNRIDTLEQILDADHGSWRSKEHRQDTHKNTRSPS
ncbi:MAG: phage shock protein B [Oceanospirillaceae bacterium]|jgi:phage shock protein B